MQLAQHELRRNNDAIEESSLRDVGNSSVDDDACIENLVTLLSLLLTAEDSAQGGQIQQIALVGTDGKANVRHQEHDHDLEETLGVSRRNATADDQREQVRPADAEEASDRGSDQALKAHRSELPLEQDDAGTNERSHTGVPGPRQVEGFNYVTGCAYNENKKKTYKNEIHGIPPRGCTSLCYWTMHPSQPSPPPAGWPFLKRGARIRGMNARPVPALWGRPEEQVD